MNLLDINIIIFSIGAYILGRYADIWTSRRAAYYATTESNKLFRAKDGTFLIGTNLLVSGIILAIGIVVAIVSNPKAIIFLDVFALGSFVVAWTNYNQQKKNRIEQTAFLQNLHVHLMAGATLNDVMPLFNGMSEAIEGGQIWFPLFAWVKVDGSGSSEEVTALIQKIAGLARESPILWFPE